MNKKAIIIIVLVAVVIVGLVLVLGGGKYSTPQKTLKTLIRSMEKGDVEGYLNCMTEKSQKLLRDAGIEDTSPEDLQKGMEDYEDPNFKTIEKEGDTATLKADDKEAYLVFKKEDAGWKLDLEETFKKNFESISPQG
tara:strand:+ start:195 stop:605 length:411 start_codon:yes stop_codon:yes gene_type:complete